MNPQLLEIRGLSAGYAGRSVLSNLDLSVATGDNIALIGPNGCGKSTLLRAVMAEIVESGGTIQHQGVEISQMLTEQIVRRGIGYLRQTRNIFPGLSVAENLDLASWGNGLERDSVLEALPMLKGRERVRAGLLSGGERQALAIAMVLMRPVSLLLLDEPIAGLSTKNATLILEGIAKLRRQERFSTIIVEHRLRLVQPQVNRVVIMVRGSVQGDTKDVSILESQARLEKFYLL